MTDLFVASASVRPEPISGADIEALAYSMANAKIGEGDTARCEGPTGYEIDMARPWARRAASWVERRLNLARKQRDEDEATAIAALKRNLDLRAAIAAIVRRALAAGNGEFTSKDAAEAILELVERPASSGRNLADATP